MCRAPLAPALLFLIGLPLGLAARAQQTAAPPVDPAAVLATLKQLRTHQTAIVNHERTDVLAAINAAIADPAKAYEQALAAVEPQGASGPPGARGSDSRRRQGDLLRNRDFVNGLRLQLIYLDLSWQHQTGIKTADLVNPLIDYAAQVTVAKESLADFEPFRRSIGQTVFATYFQVAPFLSGMTDWEDQPFDVAGIYGKTILPEMRMEKDPRILTYWDNQIQADAAKADASRNALVLNKFRAIRLPALLWSRAEDEIAIGRQNQGITDMLALLKAHPDHPDFQKWATELEALVTPKAAPSATASPAPAATP